MSKFNSDNNFIIFKTDDEQIAVDVRFEDETVWLTQEQMSVLFGKARTTITEHINNIFKEGELVEEVVCRKFRHTSQHGALKGKTQEVYVKLYNLEVIISLGYRVKSLRRTQFRIYSTMQLLILISTFLLCFNLVAQDNQIFTNSTFEIQSDSSNIENQRNSKKRKLVFMGLPRVETTTDFKSMSIYAGYGFYTTYLFTGNIGPEIRLGQNELYLGPKATIGWTNLSVQFALSSFVPIQNKMYDVILNPKIGTSHLFGIIYFEAGYNFNLTRNFNIPNMFNLTFGIQFPMNIEKFVENV